MRLDALPILTDGYVLVNLGIGGNVQFGKTAFSFNLNGNNLANKSYIAHLSRLKTNGIPLDSSNDRVPSIIK